MLLKFNLILLFSVARRRAAAKRKKLKNLGKSKSTDTEEEDADEDCGDDGEFMISHDSNNYVPLLFVNYKLKLSNIQNAIIINKLDPK